MRSLSTAPDASTNPASTSVAVDAADIFSDSLFNLPCMTLSCGSSRLAIAQQGAQALSWLDANGCERLYLSALTGGASHAAPIDGNALPQAIRGGMPVCFPQFSGRGSIMKHGFARASLWTLDSVSNAHASSRAIFTLRDDEQTRAIWPHAFLAQLTLTLETDRLIVALAVTNNDKTPWAFTGALHTYLRVADIANTELLGLQNTTYQDATNNNVEVVEREHSIRIDAELDRVYLTPPASVQLLENGKPSLTIEQSGFTDTVVWNPGPILARTLKDLPDEDWHHMLCIEAACAAGPITVQPGETWIGSQALTVA